MAQSCLICDPMDCSTPGCPALHHLWEFAQTHVHRVRDPTISSSVIPFSSRPLSFPVSGSFPISWLFTSGGRSSKASASVSIIPVNIPGWFPLGLTGLISLLSKELLRVFSSTTVWRHQFFSTQHFSLFSSHIHTWLLVKTIALAQKTFVGKVMSLVFNTLSRFVTAFLPKSKHLLISWLHSPSTVILGSTKKSLSLFLFFTPSICYGTNGTGCHDLRFLNDEF